jgi:hypothetical protein
MATQETSEPIVSTSGSFSTSTQRGPARCSGKRRDSAAPTCAAGTTDGAGSIAGIREKAARHAPDARLIIGSVDGTIEGLANPIF